jgi:hypothetical protein
MDRFQAALPAAFASTGSVLVALLIPDPAPSLTAQPAYALPLNSDDVDGRPAFDQETGYNIIAHFKVGDE